MYNYTFKMYLDSIIEQTIAAEKKSPIHYYFPFTKEVIIENIEHFKACFNKQIIPVKALIYLENDLKNKI